jgi:hypothetical protein
MGFWFGRILTFEVEADETDVLIGDLLADASGGLIEAMVGRPISGFAAHGSSISDALSGLIEVCGLPLAERGGALRMPGGGPPTLIGDEELGSGIEAAAAIERIRASNSSAPNSLTLTYYEPGRDYQTGQMRASSGHSGARDERIELPAVLNSSEAKALAEAALARRWLAADRIKVQLPPLRMDLRPGDAIQLPGEGNAWVARSVTIEGLVVTIDAEAAPGNIVPLPADPGRPVKQPDESVGRSELALFELPASGDSPAASPVAYLAASNEGAWRQLPVELALATGRLTTVAVPRRAVLGRAETVLDGRCPLIIDELSSVVVRLTNGMEPLLNADEDALINSANLAILGEELIQFGKAEVLTAGLYRLSTLLRGRRGTEWAAQGHAVGDAFCLIDRAALRSIELQPSAVGASLDATSHGIGDIAPLPTTRRLVSGEATRPPSPCQISLWREGLAVRAEWVRRSHRGWAWADSIGDPDDGFPELYRLAVTGPGGAIQVDIAAPSANWTLAELPAGPGQEIELSIVTVGPLAISRPATASLIL